MKDFEHPFGKVAAIRAVVLFVFDRRAFIDMAVRHDISWILSTDPDLKEKCLRGDCQPNENGTRKNAEARTSALRQSLRGSALLVFGSAAVAVIIGQILARLLGSPDAVYVSMLQITGAGLLLWAAIWELGWNIRSIGGESLPELVHKWLFRLLCIIGTFLLFVAAGWTL